MKEDFLAVSAFQDQVVQQSRSSWTPPPGGCFKLKVNAAYRSDSKIVSFGMVIADFSGTVRLCVVTKDDNVESSLHAEIKAVLFGLD